MEKLTKHLTSITDNPKDFLVTIATIFILVWVFIFIKKKIKNLDELKGNLNDIFDFLRSNNSVIVTLFSMVFTFFQMYGKMYYHFNPYPINWLVDIVICFVAAGALSTATFIIILHSGKTWMPFFFAGLDLIGGVLFYGKDIVMLWGSNEYLSAGIVIFIPLYKACTIYFVGEIFVEEMRKQKEKEDLRKQVSAEKKQEIRKLNADLISANEDIEELKATLSKREQNLNKSMDDFNNKERLLSDQINELNHKLSSKIQEMHRKDEIMLSLKKQALIGKIHENMYVIEKNKRTSQGMQHPSIVSAKDQIEKYNTQLKSLEKNNTNGKQAEVI